MDTKINGMKVARLKKLNSRMVNGNINSVNPTLLKSVNSTRIQSEKKNKTMSEYGLVK